MFALTRFVALACLLSAAGLASAAPAPTELMLARRGPTPDALSTFTRDLAASLAGAAINVAREDDEALYKREGEHRISRREPHPCSRFS